MPATGTVVYLRPSAASRFAPARPHRRAENSKFYLNFFSNLFISLYPIVFGTYIFATTSLKKKLSKKFDNPQVRSEYL